MFDYKRRVVEVYEQITEENTQLKKEKVYLEIDLAAFKKQIQELEKSEKNSEVN